MEIAGGNSESGKSFWVDLEEATTYNSEFRKGGVIPGMEWDAEQSDPTRSKNGRGADGGHRIPFLQEDNALVEGDMSSSENARGFCF